MSIRKSLFPALAALLSLLVVFGGAAHADEGGISAKSAAQKVDIALKQATLLEGMSQNACFAMNGQNRSRAREGALEHMDGFGTALDGLRNGHEWLGLEPEQDPEILRALASASVQWQQFKPVIDQLTNGDMHSVVIRQFMQGTGINAREARALANEILDAYGGAIEPSVRRALNEAAVQRTRTQLALHQLCLVVNGIGGDRERYRLRDTLNQIEESFRVLKDGGRAVVGAPNARIARNLRTASLFWSKMQPGFDLALRGTPIPSEELAQMLKMNHSVLRQLNQAVYGYLSTSEG